MSRRGRAAALAACSLALTLLASCQAGPGRTTRAGHGGGAQGGAVVVASFNFPESELLADALNAVSARLTSKALLFMDWRIEVAGNEVLAEARAWLERHGIVPRPG